MGTGWTYWMQRRAAYLERVLVRREIEYAEARVGLPPCTRPEDAQHAPRRQRSRRERWDLLARDCPNMPLVTGDSIDALLSDRR